MTVLSGIDVSHHQGAIDCHPAAAGAHPWASAKATEGVSLRDSRFAQNWAGMAAAGLVRGAYHFLSPSSDPAAQARAFVNMTGNLSGSLCALDVETTSSGGHPTSAMAHKFADEFRRLTGGHPLLVYTGRWYWRDILKDPYGADIGPLWHSAYSGSPGALYGGWDRFTMWQYTSSGACPGVAGRCDLNHFFGDRTALLALTGATTPPPPPPLEEDDDMKPYILAHPEGPHYYVCGPLVVFLTNGQTRVDYQDAKFDFVTVESADDAAAILEAHRNWPLVPPAGP